MSTDKIVVCVRTRDEEHRIAQFCEAYKKADLILVADGGSVDRTKEIAEKFPNVIIRDFMGRTMLWNGYWRNNDSDHANFLFRWAEEYDPYWIIYDDCDCRPNFLLKEYYRDLLFDTVEDVVMVTRFYLWGLDKHFPHMAKPEEKHQKFEPSLWAWKGRFKMETVDVPPAYTFRFNGEDIHDFHFDARTFDLMPPFALMHFSWDDPARVLDKIKMYRESGLIPSQKHPLEMGGPLEDLPSYLHE